MSEKGIILITGCSSGIGKETTLQLLKNGWHVIATMRNAESRSQDLIKSAENFSSRLHVLELEMRNLESQRKVADYLTKNSLPLFCLVNNAGFGLFGALEDLSEAQIQEQFETNFLSIVHFTRLLLPHLRKSKGRIINVSSVLGTTGMPLTSLYCASKFALEGFSESLSYELAPFGIQVALVEPGGHRTSFGTNVQWAKDASNPQSPFYSYSQRYQAFSAKKSSGKGTPPSGVAETIERLISSKNMPLRTRCGKDAKGLYLLKRFFPEPFVQRVLGYAYKRLFLH